MGWVASLQAAFPRPDFQPSHGPSRAEGLSSCLKEGLDKQRAGDGLDESLTQSYLGNGKIYNVMVRFLITLFSKQVRHLLWIRPPKWPSRGHGPFLFSP